MFRPLEIFVGLRYLRARRRNQFVSFISLMSLLGVAVGVAALIVVISVMNGFEQEIRARLLSLTAHVTVTGPGGRLADWQAAAERVAGRPGVTGVAPFVEIQGMLGAGPRLEGAVVQGVLPAREPEVSDLDGQMVDGRLADLAPGSGRIILGRALAGKLGVGPGDEVTLLAPRGLGRGLIPALRRFEVTGIFEAGMAEHDAVLALVNLEDAAAAAGMAPGQVSGIRLALADMFAAPAVARDVAGELGPGYAARDWTRENASYFRAVRIEKTMMTLVLMLVVAVAAFNIVATLVMVVTDKRSEIAILRTLGLRPGGVMSIFLVQGIIIGLAGVLLGAALGIPLALNVGTVVPWIEGLLGVQVLPADVYYIVELPSDLRGGDVARITLLAFALTALSTFYPAWRAAQTEPAEALRYEH